MSLQDIKRISIREYLGARGITPQSERGDRGMYLSPLRKESNASFSVNYTQNVWYDHGAGVGGSIIDLVAHMERCSISEAINHLEQNSSLPTVIPKPIQSNTKIEIISAMPLSHPALIDYLRDRGIDMTIAQKYCNEVRYSIGANEYFSIGFQNDAGGWELRNRNFKGSSTPKNITTFQNGSDTVMVFEGFIDFLSYLSLKGSPSPNIDTVVLNSVVNLSKAIPFLQSHRTVHAFLDNDDAGRKAVEQLRQVLPNSEVVDQSAFYRNYKDLNDYWREKNAGQSERQKEQSCPAIRQSRPKSGRKL